MKEKRTSTETTKEAQAPSLNRLGTPPPAPIHRQDSDVIHSTADFAVSEADVRTAESGGEGEGVSLSLDVSRRVLKNKLAVFGLLVVAMIVIGSLIGPPIIATTTGYTYDFIPPDSQMVKALPPFRDSAGPC